MTNDRTSLSARLLCYKSSAYAVFCVTHRNPCLTASSLGTTPPRSLSHSPHSPRLHPQMSGSLFDEVFKIDEINPDAKKFDEGAQRPHFCLSTDKSSGQ